MSQKALFQKLGAPLVNARYSWGAVRADGAVFLRVWQDETWMHGGTFHAKILTEEEGVGGLNHGYRERLKHVELVRQGAPCFMVMCQAVDPNEIPRKVKDFERDNVFLGGKLTKSRGDWCIELLKRVSVEDIAPRSGAPSRRTSPAGRAPARQSRAADR